MRTLLLAVFVAASGCGLISGPDPLEPFIKEWSDKESSDLLADDVTGAFEVPCLGPVEADFGTSRLNLAQNLAEARTALDEFGVLPFGDFCRTFDNVPLKMLGAQKTDDAASGFADGSGIRLGHNDWLIHQLMHHLDAAEKIGDTASHPGWDSNGKDAAFDTFRASKTRPALWVQ